MAYISIEVLDKEYSDYESTIRLMRIGDPQNVPFGEYMNKKYNFKSDDLFYMNFDQAYKFIKENFIK